MKFTSRILLFLLLVLLSGLLSSNIILKKQYDKIDKSDLYWTYSSILDSPFSYLKITGGNSTHIAFEQNAKPSVRVLQDWVRFHGGEVKASVKNDTLFINFDFKPANEYEKYWLQTITPLRIFAPQLVAVAGSNTNFEIFKLKQKSINVNMTGKSEYEMKPSMDKEQGAIKFHNKLGVAVTYNMPEQLQQQKSNVAMSIRSVNADLKDYTILDIGHAQIQNLQLRIADSSAIILSGGALKKINTASLVNQ